MPDAGANASLAIGPDERIRQRRKGEDPGELAGRIAHDFNNILLPILINTEIVLNEMDAESPAARRLMTVIEAARRGQDLARQIVTSTQGEAARAEESPVPYLRGTERILFVDDDDLQVRAMTRLLEHLGYRIVGKTDPVEALEAFREDPGAFDLAILDLMMPRLDGRELAGEILKVRPGFPIILCTGAGGAMDEQRALALGFRAFIMKPFLVREIALRIRRALESAS